MIPLTMISVAALLSTAEMETLNTELDICVRHGLLTWNYDFVPPVEYDDNHPHVFMWGAIKNGGTFHFEALQDGFKETCIDVLERFTEQADHDRLVAKEEKEIKNREQDKIDLDLLKHLRDKK